MNGSSQLFGTNKGLPEFGLRTQGHHATIQYVDSLLKTPNLYMCRVVKDLN